MKNMLTRFFCVHIILFIICGSYYCALTANETIESATIIPALINRNESDGATATLQPTTFDPAFNPEIFEFLSSFDEPLTFTPKNGSVTCTSDEYQCLLSQECVPLAWCCDHVIDCADGTDEWSHYIPANQTPTDQCTLCGGQSFQCPVSSECIPRGWMCDGQQDCGQTENGTDIGDEEHAICIKMGKVLLEQDNSGNLTASFMLEPTKPFVVFYNQSKILFFVKSFVNASRVFHNTKNYDTFQNISTLLTISKDRRLCWLDNGYKGIQCISMLQIIVPQKTSPISPEAVVTDILKKLLLESMPADQPKANLPVFYSLPAYIEPTSISRILLDWLTENWYLLDSKSELIYLCSSRLQDCIVIADHKILSRPLAFELDATEGLLFIARHGDRSRFGPQSSGPAILKCTLDGKNVQTLVDVRLVEPSHLAIDVSARKIFWIDTFLDILEHVDFDGQNRHQILLSKTDTLPHWSHTHSLFANANKLYLLMSHNKPNSKNPKNAEIKFVAIDTETHLFHFKTHHNADNSLTSSSLIYNVADSSLSKLIKSLCSKCTKKVHAICAPQFDYDKMQMISADCLPALETTQLANQNVSLLIYSRGEPGRITIKSTDVNYPPITFSHCPTLFDIDPITENIFYLDDCNQRLFSHSLIQSNNSPIKSVNLTELSFKQIEALSIDWRGRNIYFIDSLSASVAVLSIDNVKYKKQLITGLSNPKAVIVDPQNGLLFFSQYGNNLFEEDSEQDNPELGMFIKRTQMDGTKGQIIQKGPFLKFPNSLTIDSDARQLYWCDAFYHRIEKINYDGTNRVLLLQGLRIGIANSLHFDVLEKTLYWSELQHGTIQAFDLKTNISTVVLQEKAPIFRVKMFQKLDINTDAEMGNKCEQMKLFTTNGHVCVCADGFFQTSSNCTEIIEPPVVDNATISPCSSLLGSAVSCHSGPEGDTIACSSKHFACDQKRRCIPYNWLCDGHKDCWDRTDEAPANGGCHNSTCPPTMFRCVKRLICIDATWRCDAIPDCGPEDDSDEINC